MKEIKLSKENIILRFDWDFIDSHMYVINEKSDMLIIDPVYTDEAMMFFDENKDKKMLVLLTHEHFDHISGVNVLQEKYFAKVICSSICARRIESPAKNHSDKASAVLAFNKDISGKKSIEPFVCHADECFDGVFYMKWCSHIIKAVPTPGHTDSSVCIIIDDKIMFSGDTLLDCPTITRLPSGNKIDFQTQTLPFLFGLCGKIEAVFPGHGEYAPPEILLQQYKNYIGLPR